MNFLIFRDFSRIFSNFSKFFFEKQKKRFLMRADVATDVAAVITCHHVTKNVHATWHTCVHGCA